MMTPWIQHSVRVLTVIRDGDRTQQGGCSCGWRGLVHAGPHARNKAIRQFAAHRELVLSVEKTAVRAGMKGAA